MIRTAKNVLKRAQEGTLDVKNVDFSSEDINTNKEAMFVLIKEEKKELDKSVNNWYEPTAYKNALTLHDNKEFTLLAMEVDGGSIKYASDRLKADKDVALTAVKNFGWAIELVSPRLANDPDIALVAIKDRPAVFEEVSDGLKGNPEFVLKALKEGCNIYSYLSDDLKERRDIVLAALSFNGRLIAKEIPDEYCGDKEVVETAIKGGAVQSDLSRCPAEAWNDDKELALQIIKNAQNVTNWDSFKLKDFSADIKDDKDVVLYALRSLGEYPALKTLVAASERLKGDKEVALEAVKQYEGCGDIISEELRHDKKFVLRAMSVQPCLFPEHVPEIYRDDKDVALLDLSQDSSNYSCLSDRLKRDPDIISVALQNNAWICFDSIPEELKDVDTVAKAVANGATLRQVPEKFRDNEAVVYAVALSEGVKNSEISVSDETARKFSDAIENIVKEELEKISTKEV